MWEKQLPKSRSRKKQVTGQKTELQKFREIKTKIPSSRDRKVHKQ